MSLQFRQAHPMFVGEIDDLDLSKPIAQADVDDLEKALDKFAVLIIHGSPLTEEAQVAFAERFGPLEDASVLSTNIKARVNPKLGDISNLDESSNILEATDRRRMFALGNQLWHTDSSFKKTPAKYSMLHAHSVTPEGGETQFVDTRAAHDALSDTMKAHIETLAAEHSIFVSRGKLGFENFSEEERKALPPVHRNLVRVHPGSGRKALYLASHASHVVGRPLPDGRMLIHELIEHATQPQFVHTHKWTPGDLVIWDNRCTMHRGRPYDEAKHRRDMRRATVSDIDGVTQADRAA